MLCIIPFLLAYAYMLGDGILNYALILAAGIASRMSSDVYKYTIPILGKEMLLYTVDAIKNVAVDKIICILGYKKEALYSTLKNEKIDIKIQQNPNGTLDAVKCADDLISGGYTIILYADNPLITSNIINEMIKYHLSNNNDVTKANGIFIFKTSLLLDNINYISKNEITNEYEMDDLINYLYNYKIDDYLLSDSYLSDVNTMSDLSITEEKLNNRIRLDYLKKGIRIDSNSIISPDALIEDNCEIINSRILGNSLIHKGSIVKGSEINNSIVFENNRIINSVITDSIIGNSCDIGPFSHIRNNSIICGNNRIGNFVEVKNSKIGEFSKLSHHAYMGDTVCGENVNFGCGAITVNYDGRNKHKTIIGNNSFIGCNCNLIAPIKIDDNCYIAAGSTITNDTSNGDFAIARAMQIIKEDYAKKYK